MRKTTDTVYWAGGAALTLLTGGLLLLPLGLVFLGTLLQRREELRKGELADAKNY
ncbi:hypothetical protein [Pseudoflavonifractor sp. 60]|uniref:hypothetical protein n=1 Tax=Pseudoflavonifractor sp. 60 TaxID=2304576 RepID=UPI00137213C5|nr:hypothetical protein [Pseudoflavonifractor sp. 60]